MRALLHIPNEGRLKAWGRHYFSSVDAFKCKPPGGCVWQDNGKLLYQDRGHLSPAGSIFFAERFADWFNHREKN